MWLFSLAPRWNLDRGDRVGVGRGVWELETCAGSFPESRAPEGSLGRDTGTLPRIPTRETHPQNRITNAEIHVG